jgi:hypothetical protein
MTRALSSTPAQRPTIGRKTRSRRRSQHARPADRRITQDRERALGRYTDARGDARELIARRGAAGSVLVVDRDSATLGDCLLVAHLAADEPATNAALVCRHYLNSLATSPCRCRRLTAADAQIVPFAEEHSDARANGEGGAGEEQLIDRFARAYRLVRVDGSMSIPELRWCRSGDASLPAGAWAPLSMREVIAALESYEPVRTHTLRALAASDGSHELSTTVLRAELVRVQESPIVLNLRLREVLLSTVRREQLSLSEIAIRCGRIKRDRNGAVSGETSWLSRRIGVLAEGGQDRPTPWIHSDVLALIARRGLGISPREVEL